MSIQKAKQQRGGYQVTVDGGRIIFVPRDPANRDCHALQEWLAAGNELEPEFTLDELRQRQISVLAAACAAAITSGYPSSALGTEHIYPSNPTDQSNMQASVIESLLPDLPPDWTTPFTCVEPVHKADAEWPLRDHTAAQIQQAGQDGKAYILAQRVRLRTLIAQVNAAESQEDIEAIAW